MDSQEAIAPLAVDSKVAAKMLSISERTFWELRSRGEIPHIKIGRLTRFVVSDLARFLELKRAQNVQDAAGGNAEPADQN
jgi:excisionase family DNA binding protein